MTPGSLFSQLSDMDYRAAQIELRGEQAIQFCALMGAMEKQPQILPEHEDLVRERRHIIFLAMNMVEGRAVPEPGDVVIGSLCGRTVIVPKVMT